MDCRCHKNIWVSATSLTKKYAWVKHGYHFYAWVLPGRPILGDFVFIFCLVAAWELHGCCLDALFT